MAITPEQRAILLQSQNFKEQTGIAPKSPATLSEGVKPDDLRAKLMGIGAPKVEEVVNKQEVKTPQYSEPMVSESKLGQAVTGMAKGGYEVLKGTMDTAELLLKEKAKQTLDQNIPFAKQILGFAKDRFGIELPEESVATIIQHAVENKKNLEPDTLLKANTPTEKAFKFGTEAASVVAPVGESGLISKAKNLKGGVSKAEKALELSNAELSKISKTKLPYLSKQALETAETVGGVIKEKSYKMVDQVKKLAEEFKGVLTGKNPEENLKLAQQAGKELDKNSDELVTASNKIINAKTLKNTLSRAISGIKDSAYAMASKEQRKALAESVISDFMSYVKKGDLEGINQARKAWSKANRGTTGVLSKANQVMHRAIQDIIEKSLPDDARRIYQSNKTQMAKLYDIREILRAKVAASIGQSTLKTVRKKVSQAAGLAAGGGIIGYGLSKLNN